METLLALVVGGMIAASVYLLLQRSLVRIVFGLIVLSNAVNLLIFAVGRLTRGAPPIIEHGHSVPQAAYANPLPQALILTAIVISFGLLAFALALVYRSYRELDTLSADDLPES